MKAFILAVALFSSSALAQTEMMCTGQDTTGDTQRLSLDSSGRIILSSSVIGGANISAQSSGTTTQVNLPALVDGGCTNVPPVAMLGRRAVEIFNAGPTALACRAGGGTPGRPIAASTGTWSIDASDAIPICCDTTVAQVDGGSTWVTEIK